MQIVRKYHAKILDNFNNYNMVDYGIFQNDFNIFTGFTLFFNAHIKSMKSTILLKM